MTRLKKPNLCCPACNTILLKLRTPELKRKYQLVEYNEQDTDYDTIVYCKACKKHYSVHIKNDDKIA